MIIPRHFNQIDSNEEGNIVKVGNIDGERYWYLNIPENIKAMFPKLIDYGDTFIEVEGIDGTPLSYKFVSGEMTEDNLYKLLSDINCIHNSYKFVFDDYSIVLNSYFNNENIYANYADKIKFRFCNYDYKFKGSVMFANTLFKLLKEYENKKDGVKAVIHGDPVFTNILIDNDGNYKYIDMRGKLGCEYSIYGDINYDYAKIYQSLCCYDFILHDIVIDFDYVESLKKVFEAYIIEMFGYKTMYYIKFITASLLFSIIPLHNNLKCGDYYELARKIL